MSLHADYSLRVLIYLGSHPRRASSTLEISRAYGISRHHLVRVMHTLAEHGYVELMPGRRGGVKLSRDPGEIRLGQVVRDAEFNMRLVECFDAATNTCPITKVCGLKSHLRDALEAFLADLNRHTLAELLTPERSKKLTDVFVKIAGT